MICICCQTIEARPHDEFCSDKCEEMYAEGRSRRICKSCGGWFNRAPKSRNTICPKCRYLPSERMQDKAEKKRKKTALDEALKMQKEIHERTGRWISYGQLMAGKHE